MSFYHIILACFINESSFDRSQCIQLSPDSSYVLTSICSESQYVIAGLTDGAGVEKNTLIRAESFHIAKLPINKCLKVVYDVQHLTLTLLQMF